MSVTLKRVYETASRQDGYRVLVELWPRGVSIDEALLDDWLKEMAPGDELRSAFHQGDIGWGKYRHCYLGEPKRHSDALRPLALRQYLVMPD